MGSSGSCQRQAAIYCWPSWTRCRNTTTYVILLDSFLGKKEFETFASSSAPRCTTRSSPTFRLCPLIPLRSAPWHYQALLDLQVFECPGAAKWNNMAVDDLPSPIPAGFGVFFYPLYRTLEYCVPLRPIGKESSKQNSFSI